MPRSPTPRILNLEVSKACRTFRTTMYVGIGNIPEAILRFCVGVLKELEAKVVAGMQRVLELFTMRDGIAMERMRR